MNPNIFSLIYPKEVSMYNFINKLISLFTRETVKSIALDKVFVKKGYMFFNIIKIPHPAPPSSLPINQFSSPFYASLANFENAGCWGGGGDTGSKSTT